MKIQLLSFAIEMRLQIPILALTLFTCFSIDGNVQSKVFG